MATAVNFGVDIAYSEKGGELLGTAGAIRKAERFLARGSFLTYGDPSLPLGYRAAMAWFLQYDKLGLVVVHRKENRYGRSNVVVEDGLVKEYDKQHLAGADRANGGDSL